jgi:hypothetical protein
MRHHHPLLPAIALAMIAAGLMPLHAAGFVTAAWWLVLAAAAGYSISGSV